jgi:ubiquinone/menaquinone biosynthesis C-methylase UbiE
MDPGLQRRVQRYGWDKASPFYENSWKAQLKPAQDKLLELAELRPGDRVIETACGTGLVTFRAAKAVESDGEVLATDISEKMIERLSEIAEENGISNIKFLRMDAEALELDDRQFDIALDGLGMMYYPDPVKALKEKSRVLKPGGRVAVAVWGERKNCGWADIFPIVENQVASDVCPMFFQLGTGSALANSMKQAGFTGIETVRIDVGLQYKSPEEALTAAFSGGPVALAYHKFDESVKETVHKEYLESISPFINGKGYVIPGEFVVARAINPK